jgi:hypothetical protein
MSRYLISPFYRRSITDFVARTGLNSSLTSINQLIPCPNISRTEIQASTRMPPRRYLSM